MSESHNELGSLGWGDLLLFDEVHDGNQRWVGSRTVNGIEEII